jgi:hypothetical protein
LTLSDPFAINTPRCKTGRSFERKRDNVGRKRLTERNASVIKFDFAAQLFTNEYDGIMMVYADAQVPTSELAAEKTSPVEKLFVDSRYRFM